MSVETLLFCWTQLHTYIHTSANGALSHCHHGNHCHGDGRITVTVSSDAMLPT